MNEITIPKMKQDERGKFIKGHYQGFGFKKGCVAWNEGKNCPQEVKDKISKATLGQHRSPYTEFKETVPIGHKWIRNDKWNKEVLVKIASRKYKGEHIVIAEKVYGKLEKGECVHHIDLNPFNNSPDNLYIASISYHKKLHSFEPIIANLLKKRIIKFDRNKGEYCECL